MTDTDKDQDQDQDEPTTGEDNAIVLQFLYAAITDGQAVIRALDTKLSAAIVIFALAIPKLDAIAAQGKDAIRLHFCVAWVLIALFCLSWFFGFFAGIRGLVAIDNPADHIEEGQASGLFYGGSIFTTTFWNSFFNTCTAKRPSLDERLTQLQINAERIRAELAFEHLKLAYIRSVKLRRAKTAFVALILWTLTGASLWLMALHQNGKL